MASVPPVGSLDTWLPSFPASSSCAAARQRQESPFAAIALATRHTSSTEPVPIPLASTKPSRSAALVPLEPAALRDTFGCSSHRTAFSSGKEAHRANTVSSIKLQHHSGEERTVRFGKQRSFGNATSLPMIATQGSVCLESLCTALSSPASNATLAAAHAQQSANKTPASTAAEAAATAAAAAAFARSLAWDPEPLPTGLSASWAAGDAGAPKLPAGLQTVSYVGPHIVPRIEVPQVAAQGPCLASLEGRLPACTTSSRLSTKRGLYEGTVRGGSPRNTWQYSG